MIAVLGSFDGFHRGHALLFERARVLATASPLNLSWGAVTFDPHPGLFMKTMTAALFTPQERERIRRFLEIPQIVSLKFDEELQRYSPELFWQFLRERVAVEGIVVGEDFRFGYRRAGDAALMERYCREAGVRFLRVDILEHAGGKGKISSSAIRQYVETGQCELAAKELGYPYFIEARVVHGLGRGRKIGFPTANLEAAPQKLLPPDGVYAAAVLIEEGCAAQWKAGALSVGRNPTFNDVPDVRIEVFVLDYEGDLYGKNLPVFLLSRLRPQMRFNGTEELMRQINEDVRQARTAFPQNLKFFPDPDWRAGFVQTSC